jgi:hypothetical protein
VHLADAVRPSDRDYDTILFIRGVAATILVSAYNSDNFSIQIGRNERAEAISYASYFGSLFRYASSPRLRQQWQRVPVIVAVSSPVGCDIFTMMGSSSNFVGHWMNGARDPIRPSVTFGVSLTPSNALTDRNAEATERACRDQQSRLGVFDNPRFVVVGRLICAEAACSSLPRFLVSRIYFTYSGANTLPGYGDYMRNALSILSELRRAGVR